MRRRDFMAAVSTILAAAAAQPARAQNKTKIKAAQIGTAHAHASGKMATMRKYSDDYEIVGFAEPDKNLRIRAAIHPTYRDLKWMSVDDLLATPGLQVVAVETQVRDLVPTAHKCIAAGVSIHLDKPAGESLEEFKKLLSAATAKKLIVQMGYMLRYNPAMQLTYKLAKEGWLGELFEANATMSKTISSASERKQLAQYPGGTMFELGCHVIDSLVHVLGQPQKVHAFGRKMKPKQDGLVDNQLAVLEYEKATATVRSAMVEVSGEKRRQFVLCGDQGTIDIRPLEPGKMLLALSKARDPYKSGYQEIELPKSLGRYDGEFIDLAKILRGEKQPDFTPDHDLAVHETILRASGVMV